MGHLPAWRPMTPEDIPAVLGVADRVHPDLPEDIAVIAERQRLYPAGAYLLEREGVTCGYLISHPWRSALPPALNVLLHRLPPNPDTFYLHDLALLPAGRGEGAARAIVEHMVAHACSRGFATMHLTAVNGSVPFWMYLGFVVETGAHAADHLRSYGDSARSMVRDLAG